VADSSGMTIVLRPVPNVHVPLPSQYKSYKNFSFFFESYGGPGSSVGIATELRAGRFGTESRWERDFPPVQTGPGATQPPVKCVPVLFRG
jgi:hypothetical protein